MQKSLHKKALISLLSNEINVSLPVEIARI